MRRSSVNNGCGSGLDWVDVWFMHGVCGVCEGAVVAYSDPSQLALISVEGGDTGKILAIA